MEFFFQVGLWQFTIHANCWGYSDLSDGWCDDCQLENQRKCVDLPPLTVAVASAKSVLHQSLIWKLYATGKFKCQDSDLILYTSQRLGLFLCSWPKDCRYCSHSATRTLASLMLGDKAWLKAPVYAIRAACQMDKTGARVWTPCFSSVFSLVTHLFLSCFICTTN